MIYPRDEGKVDVLKKTALMVDHELVAQAKEILGTSTTTETLAEALREVIRVQGRARHFERLRRREGLDFDDPEVADGAWREFGDPPR
jgi:Arc/MetJ family transcription regulator